VDPGLLPAETRRSVIKILAIDQARRGAWAVFDTQTKALEHYGVWEFSNRIYPFPKAVHEITSLIDGLLKEYRIGAVYIEDVSLGPNPQAFKRLAQLQGALINLFEQLSEADTTGGSGEDGTTGGSGVTYGIIPPTQWQTFCGALQKHRTKELSLAFVKERFGIATDDHNLTDAICLGWYAVNNLSKMKG